MAPVTTFFASSLNALARRRGGMFRNSRAGFRGRSLAWRRRPVLTAPLLLSCEHSLARAGVGQATQLQRRASKSAAGAIDISAAPAPQSASSDIGQQSGVSSAGRGGDSGKSGGKESGSWGWGKTLGVAASTVSGIIVLYYFWKSGYSLHKTELLLLERFRSLPFYWPPGPGPAYRNSHIEHEGLSEEFVHAFAAWFIVTDLQVSEGVTRDEVLELIVEFGFKEDEKPCKDFLQRGEGQLEERRRLSSCGLQESVTLLSQLAMIKPTEEEQRPELGQVAVDLLRRKVGGINSVLNNASLMQQATLSSITSGGGSTGSGFPGLAPGTVGPVAPGASVMESEDEGAIDEAQQRRLEAAQITRVEDSLIAKLERQGSLSAAEEVRLADIRQRKARLLSLGA